MTRIDDLGSDNVRKIALNLIAEDIAVIWLHQVDGVHVRLDSRGRQVVVIGRWMEGDAPPEIPDDPLTIRIKARP